jgi:hypothetical protein
MLAGLKVLHELGEERCARDGDDDNLWIVRLGKE